MLSDEAGWPTGMCVCVCSHWLIFMIMFENVDRCDNDVGSATYWLLYPLFVQNYNRI